MGRFKTLEAKEASQARKLEREEYFKNCTEAQEEISKVPGYTGDWTKDSQNEKIKAIVERYAPKLRIRQKV